MAKDFIGYQALADAALRGVVREALRRVEKQGLVGAHHFRVTFKTGFPGVEIPDRSADAVRRSRRCVRTAIPRSGRRR